jgi:two-component system, OmpR family, alkaline phosphatase synthesis response regulator PhoP
MVKRVLLAEDEDNLRDVIKLNLELEGFSIEAVSDGAQALRLAGLGGYDLIILDVMLPELSGFEACEAIREKDKSTPILFLTAKNSGEDRVRGLKLGADDYLAKPFNLEELILRVNILIKRRGVNPAADVSEFWFGSNCVNFQTFEIIDKYGKRQTIGKREIELLKLLIEKKNKVVSRDEILDKLWGSEAYPSTRTIDNYILAFRKYFEDNPREAKYFHSIRGVGYKFTDSL